MNNISTKKVALSTNIEAGNVIRVRLTKTGRNTYAIVGKVYDENKFFITYLDDGTTYPDRCAEFPVSIDKLLEEVKQLGTYEKINEMVQIVPTLHEASDEK